MQTLFFWKGWLKEYRLLWYFSGGVLVFTILFLWFSYFRGAHGVTQWLKVQEQKVIETTVHSFRLGPFELNVPGESYVVFEYFHGSDIIPNTLASYIFLMVLVMCALILLSVITTLERFWFFVGMGLFILFVASLRLEVLGLFGQYNRIPVVVALILYVVPAFYFNRINPGIPFFIRLALFFGLAVLVALTIHFFAGVGYPFYHLTLTGYVSGLVLTVIFITMVAHEILAAFVNLVSRGSSNSLRHLSLIAVFYMGNIIITCLHELGNLSWNFLYINLFLLLTVSAVLGIWGFRQREPVYRNMITFAPFGAFLFVSLAAIAFATTGMLLGNHNDAPVRIIRDIIIFSHTGYGIIFLTYIFSNFVLMLARDMPVYKVLYNPTRMPYFTFRFAGLIAVLGFVFYSNWRWYVYDGVAGFYNTAGDLYSLLGNDPYAQSFYEQARVQGFQNNRSNYVLAATKAGRLNLEEAHDHYAAANALRPTLFSLTNDGNLYLWEQEYFTAIREYREANERVGGSSILENNLGFAYAQVHNLDSALFYLNSARADDFTKTSAETNFFALAATELIPLRIDSVVQLFKASGPSVIGNALALSTLQRESIDLNIQPVPERQLNLYTATLLNNYIIKYAASMDTALINQAYRVASDSVNEDFSEAIKASLSFAYYLHGDVSKALQIMAELAYVTQQYQGKFNYIMGLWALEQRNPDLASQYFTFADTYDYKEARFYNAIALSEVGRTNEALIAWDTVARADDEAMQVIGSQMIRLLTLSPAEALSLSDPEKYQFCRYRLPLTDSVAFRRLASTFENDNYRAQAILDRSHRYLEANQLVASASLFASLQDAELTDQQLYNEARHFELKLLAYTGDISALSSKMKGDIPFTSAQGMEKLLYQTLIAEAQGDTTNLRTNYEILAKSNPYLEEAVIAAAAYFRNNSTDPLHAYNVLAEAIQVNNNSVRLLIAYINEARARGFDEYAESAYDRLVQLSPQ